MTVHLIPSAAKPRLAEIKRLLCQASLNNRGHISIPQQLINRRFRPRLGVNPFDDDGAG